MKTNLINENNEFLFTLMISNCTRMTKDLKQKEFNEPSA